MKKHLFILLFFIGFLSNAQIRISGKVLDSNNEPLIGASVYLNNTSIGTTTNDLGEFELSIKKGIHDLIVSYLGYETIQYQIDTNKPTRKFTFKTKAADNVLDEIVIRNKKYSAEDRAYFLSRFRTSFIGKTELSRNCKIINPDVIQFDFNPLSNVLDAYVSKPIEIVNKDLGYKIYYDLVHYELSQTKITYLGYSRYEQMKGGKSKRRKWKKNRLIAYNGSKMHFIRAARNGTLYEDGFVINQSKRIPNPNRPSDSILKETRKYLRTLNTNSSTIVNLTITPNNDKGLRDAQDKIISKIKKDPRFKNMHDSVIANLTNNPSFIKKYSTGKSISKTVKEKKDSVMEILSRGRLKRFIDVKLKDSLTEKDFLFRSNKDVIMKFKHYLEIKYMNEKEEYNFRKGPNRLDYQASKLILYTESVLLDKSGIFIEPLDIFMEGYWGYEKTANALPLDYFPDN